MKSFVKGLWSRTKSDPVARQLDHPRSLQLGDYLKMSDSFGLPERLRDQVFEVAGVSTWQFEHQFETCFNLSSKDNDNIDLTIENESGRESATFSISINRGIVTQVFDEDEFSLVFDDEQIASLNTAQKLDLASWLSDRYVQQSNGERGYYYDKDCRAGKPSIYEGDGEPFDFYSLLSPDESHGVEIAVYASGETEVSLNLYRKIEDIAELWPAANQENS